MYIQTQWYIKILVDYQNYCESYASIRFWLGNILSPWSRGQVLGTPYLTHKAIKWSGLSYMNAQTMQLPTLDQSPRAPNIGWNVAALRRQLWRLHVNVNDMHVVSSKTFKIIQPTN